ncbi:MAG: tRNA (guanosine(46)-N7)-methyltransferase TrmB [Sulfuricaulis sp.]|uniref:tRNA (guanosine(46)-N7)-methyltransferase TrmB n=1 Tax=Sulfuricaulis sp. TaxID=2003553 RepID=UPI0034A2630F
MSEAEKHLRPIRSFVRREGRITPAQSRALKELWPHYGIDLIEAPIDFARLYGRSAPVILEIGFGNGEALLASAKAHPDMNYLGIEVHRPGVGGLLRHLEAEALDNVRIILADAKDVLAKHIPDGSLAAMQLFFPDPWPKKRHHKRRLVQPDFAALMARKLKPGGYIHLATDWQDYATQMVSVLSQTPELQGTSRNGPAQEYSGNRPATKFETRGKKLGHEVWDMVFYRSR